MLARSRACRHTHTRTLAFEMEHGDIVLVCPTPFVDLLFVVVPDVVERQVEWDLERQDERRKMIWTMVKKM